MRCLWSIHLLPPALLALLPLAAGDVSPTALRKLSPDSNEKILPEHLAFAPIPDPLSLPSDLEYLEPNEHGGSNASAGLFYYRRAFSAHFDETHEGMLRRAAEALAILEKRSSCPAGMESCDSIGARNKCCQRGTYCTDVPDSNVGNVACCPEGSRCGGAVGKCPSSAVSCPSELGGGCCIPGFSCQGAGCKKSLPSGLPCREKADHHLSRRLDCDENIVHDDRGADNTSPPNHHHHHRRGHDHRRGVLDRALYHDRKGDRVGHHHRHRNRRCTLATNWELGRDLDRRNKHADWLYDQTTPPDPIDEIISLLTKAPGPKGFYGCLATHGGGCCRTDRNCETHSCPPPSSTTTISGSATVVVVGDDLPAPASGTCASGWFMCGDDAGPTAGCCPSGYDCGTASCFTVQASQTGSVQKELPKDGGHAAVAPSPWWLLAVAWTVMLGSRMP